MNNVSTVHSTTSAAGAPAGEPRTETHVDRLLHLYRTHYTNLVRLTMLLVRDVDVARRVVDEVFVAHARAGRQAEGAPTIAVLRNAVVVAARQCVPAPPDAPSDADGVTLLDALYSLPHPEREALVLQHYGALSDADVAAAAGASYEVVTHAASEGLRALHARLVVGEAT
jgi:DNA-directed RNA polymerase specialized sigma24 family protein